jgi:hypothetical protein
MIIPCFASGFGPFGKISMRCTNSTGFDLRMCYAETLTLREDPMKREKSMKKAQKPISRTAIKGTVFSVFLFLGIVALEALTTPAAAQILPNQTVAFGGDQLLLFSYLQSYQCVDQNFDDLNFNGILAQSDPSEFQTPICQVGHQSSVDPTGLAVGKTDKLYILVPFFDANPSNDTVISSTNTVNGVKVVSGTALQAFLLANFKMVPEAFKVTPDVAVQCPTKTSMATYGAANSSATMTCFVHPGLDGRLEPAPRRCRTRWS